MKPSVQRRWKRLNLILLDLVIEEPEGRAPAADLVRERVLINGIIAGKAHQVILLVQHRDGALDDRFLDEGAQNWTGHRTCLEAGRLGDRCQTAHRVRVL